MKTHAILLSLAVSGVVGAPSINYETVESRHGLFRRQFDLGGLLSSLTGPGGLGNLGGLMSKAAKTDKLAPQIRKEANRERLWFGPYTLPPANATRSGRKVPFQMDLMGTQIDRPVSGFCTDCTILYTKAALYFENGTKATVEQGVYEHHVVMVDLAKRTMPLYLCNGQKGFLGQLPAVGFVISGNDEAANWFTTPDGNFNSGYVVGPRQMLAMQTELVNYRNEEQKVYVTVDYEYIRGKSNTPADSTISLFSVTGCNSPDYHRDASKKVYNMSSETVSFPTDGFIINAKGHLHDGGDHIILQLNGKIVCDSKAVYGPLLKENGMEWAVIEKMTQCTEPIKVSKGDKLYMRSFYDTEKHPPRPSQNGQSHAHEGGADEMGVFFINFAKTNQTAAALKIKADKKSAVLIE